MEKSIDELFELDSLTGRPDGPVKYVDVLDMEVPTYLDERRDMWGHAVQAVLMHHVPLRFRGFYKVRAGVTVGPHGEPVNDANYCMCKSKNLAVLSGGYKAKQSGKQCGNRAMNYSGYCGMHGGALHPYDKSNPKLTREMAFKAGKLDVRDMDDEELARGQVRRDDGTWTNFRTIPAAVFQAAQAELFQRADIKLRENLITAVETMAEIAKGSAYEPEVRIRAAQFIYERVRGKNPDVVVHTQDKPFEIMMTDVVLGGGSRAASRAARGIESAVDAEVVEYDDAVVVYDDSDNLDPGLDSLEDGEEVELVPLQPEPAVHHGSVGMEVTTPPADPLLRDRWEREKAENEAVVEESVAELQARMKKLRDQARAKRYAARSKGLGYVESHAYTWENQETWIPDPAEPEYEIPANIVRFGELDLPKVPASVKANDTRRIKRTR